MEKTLPGSDKAELVEFYRKTALEALRAANETHKAHISLTENLLRLTNEFKTLLELHIQILKESSTRLLEKNIHQVVDELDVKDQRRRRIDKRNFMRKGGGTDAKGPN